MEQTTLEHVKELSHPESCYGGFVFVGLVEVDEESGEEVERVARYRCRQCEAEMEPGNLAWPSS